MTDEIPQRRPRAQNRPKPKLMSQGEQDALAAQRTAKREGAVAFHYQKSRESCPLDEADPLRAHWLEGWDAASQRRNRLDMSPATAEGYRAFQDGLHPHECRYGRTQAATEWVEGRERASRAKDREDERRYR